jgi:hypothetical protein
MVSLKAGISKIPLNYGVIAKLCGILPSVMPAEGLVC